MGLGVSKCNKRIKCGDTVKIDDVLEYFVDPVSGDYGWRIFLTGFCIVALFVLSVSVPVATIVDNEGDCNQAKDKGRAQTAFYLTGSFSLFIGFLGLILISTYNKELFQPVPSINNGWYIAIGWTAVIVSLLMLSLGSANIAIGNLNCK